MNNEYIEGIAGAPIEVGQTVARGPGGKYYPAKAIDHIQRIAPAAEPIKKGNVIYLDRGVWRPVNNQTK